MQLVTAARFTGAALLLTVALTACIPFYGARYDYPADLSVPQSATVVLTEDSWDDDDPIRSRVQVVDFGSASEDEVLNYYAGLLTAEDGWEEVAPEGRELLCLVRTGHGKFTEAVGVFAYSGQRVKPSPHRYVVINSRISDAWGDPCRLATRWVAMDLL